MSQAQQDRKVAFFENSGSCTVNTGVENLIAEYRELADVWNGKCLQTESKMQEIAGELEDYGINVEEIE